jgi:CopG family nickel-responsive transcriptional regulator
MTQRLRRFSVSMEEELLKLLDAHVKEGRYPNRSDALRAFVRHQSTHRHQEMRGEVIGHISLVYDHHQRNLVNKILQAQHNTSAAVLGAQHFHLDHHHCIESILARGKARDLEALHKTLQALRGIKHVSFSIVAPAKDLK